MSASPMVQNEPVALDNIGGNPSEDKTIESNHNSPISNSPVANGVSDMFNDVSIIFIYPSVGFNLFSRLQCLPVRGKKLFD